MIFVTQADNFRDLCSIRVEDGEVKKEKPEVLPSGNILQSVVADLSASIRMEVGVIKKHYPEVLITDR